MVLRGYKARARAVVECHVIACLQSKLLTQDVLKQRAKVKKYGPTGALFSYLSESVSPRNSR